MLEIFHHDIPKDYRLLEFVIYSNSYNYATLEDCDLIVHNEFLWGLEKRD